MDTPKFKGEWDGFKGYVSMTWDKLSNDELVRVEGSFPSLVSLIEEKYKHPKEQIEQSVENLFNLYLEKKSAIKQEIDDFREDLSLRSSEFIGKIREKSQAYTHAAREKMDRVREENIEPVVHRSEDYIKANPFTTVFAALGIGLIVGGIVGLLSSKD